MRKRALLLLAMLLVVAALGTATLVRSAGNDPAPQVIESAPSRGEEIPSEGGLTLYFDQAMDRTSVEKAFKVEPAVTGTFSWPDDLTVVFKPSAPLAKNTEYVFSVSTDAKSQTQVPLKDTYTLKLRTPGVLAVTQIIPGNNAHDVEATPTITVIFNRPVVPLLPVEEMATLPSPITITPAAEGKGEWLNTSIYTFKPTTPLAGGTRYMITVNKGLTDVTGSALPNDVVATFSTVSPRIIEVSVNPIRAPSVLDSTIEVVFSQPMDKQATEKSFSLKNTGPSAKPIDGSFTWDKDGYKLTYKPTARLDYSTTYEYGIDKAVARSVTGGLLEAGIAKTFATIQTPDIVNTRPGDGEVAYPYGGFELTFSAPMKLADFKSHVTIEPKPGLYYEDNADDDGFWYQIGFGTEPSTDYTITIDTNGLVDKYGTPLKLDSQSPVYKIVAPGKAQIKYTTQAYPAEASLKTGSYIGLYSAYRPLTRVFSTHRNISTLELGLYGLPVTDFMKLAATQGYDFRRDYKPTDFLRRWTLPVANDPNVLRYDLLTISTQGPNMGQRENVTCVGAPPSRIKSGDKVIVLKDDPTPQRIRERPGVKAKVVGQAKPGVEFNILGGPVCADKFVWWQVNTTDNTLTGWTAEGDNTHYFIGHDGDSSAVVPVPTLPPATANNDAKAEALKPGIYWLEFSSPDLPDNGSPLEHLMVVSTANITLKITERDAIAWVTDLQSGKPVPNVDVKFYIGDKADTLGTAKTDANGIAHLVLKDKLGTLYTDIYATVADANTFGISVSNWTDGIEPWAFEQDGNFYPQDLTVYLYTERPLYRPGQPVYFRGVLRSKNDVTYGLTDTKTVPVEVIDDQGKSIFQKDLPVTAFGTFAGSFDLDANAALGSYRIVARPPMPEATTDNQPEFAASFSVAEYRLPEFQVKATAEQDQVLQGDKIKVSVDSSFFFGGAVSNAKVTWTVLANDYFFNYKGSGGYSFVDYNEDAGASENETPYGNNVAEGEGKTDAQGKFTVEVPADLGKAPRSQTFTIEAMVTDESDQQVAGRVEVTVHQGQFYIGVKPQEYVGAAAKSQKIDVISVDWNSQPMPGADISMKVVERVWSSVQTVEPGTGRTVWNYEVKENPVTDGVVHTGQDGKAVYEFTPAKGGIYKIYATSRDSKGNQVTSSTFAWIAGPDYVPWRQQNSNRIDLKIDRDDYNIGDTASILIASPFQGEATALITVERGHILQTEVVKMPTNSYVYKLPITADMAPNAYVSVMVVKGVDEKNPVAAFRMGLIQLSVQTDRLKLNVEVTSDKPQAGPREKVNYTVHVTDYKGNPVQAEVGVALVDQAALSLLPDQSTPILQYFYGKQGLGVRTASALTMSVDQQTQQIINTVKGGGGGGPEGGIFEVRQEFVTTPLWSPSVMTDASGNASVAVTLPDNLTTWRLDARAVTQAIGDQQTTLVGQTTSDLISTKPLLIRPVTPRFYVIGDTSTLAAVVNNNTDQAQDVTVKIEATGVQLKGDAVLKSTIPAKGRARFEWPVEVMDVNAVGVTFFASNADNKYSDAAKSAVGQGDDKTLPVLRYEAPETVGTAGMITKEGGSNTEGIVLPRRFNVTQGTVDIRIDPSLAATTVDALKVLKNYPYQCLEQTVSRFLPNLMTYRAFKQLGIDDQAMKAELSTVIDYAVQRLYAEQHVDGGWGWFVRDESDPMVTAYAVIGLSEAQKDGFAVDKNVLAKAIAFVQKNVKDIGQQPETWQLNRQAFMLYVLARADAGNVSQSVRLFNVREKMSIYARAYLAMTFHMLTPNDNRYSDVLLTDIQSRAIASATGMHWEEDYSDYWNWNTDTRSTAIVLTALVQIQPDNALIPNVVRWLMIARKADDWETTQETAWAVMALTDWMQHTGELKPNYTFSVGVNDTALKTDQAVSPDNVKQSVQLQVAVKDLLAAQVNKLIISRSSGDGVLYYTAHLTAYLPVEQVKPLSRGISVTRTYSLYSDKEHKPITEARVGDIIRVSLSIVAPNDLNYVVINDPIPAGTEAINPDLATTASVGKAPELKLDDPLSQGWGWWWFSNTELRDEKTVLYASYLPAGTYQFTYSLRAGLAGQYHVIPTTGQEFYFPEVYGRSDGMLFNILPGTTQETTVITP